MKRACLTAAVMCLALCSVMQGRLWAAQPPAATTKPATRVIKFKHLRIDLAKREVIIDAEVCLRKGPLELLLCKWGTKEHESILRTKAQPSKLHAALLALGLMPGKPAEWIMDDTDTAGRTIPPRGAAVTVAIRWRDKSGKTRHAMAGDLLKMAGKGKAVMPREWVFVGSDMLPGGGYWADGQGDIISVANFASSVLDVPFESSVSEQQLTFTANTAAIAPLGTAVEVVITPVARAEKSPHARATLTIGDKGQFDVDGRKVSPDGLAEWAGQFIEKHSKGRVVILPHPLCLSADVARARTELRLGGVHFFSHRWYGESYPVAPRTAKQAAAAMKEWTDKFANPQDYIQEPSQQARQELTRLRKKITRLARQRRLLELHVAELQQALSLYKPPARESLPTSGDAPGTKQPDK